DAATKRLAANVQNLASAAKAVAPGADAVAPAVVNLVAWVVGAALDQERFETLKRTVKLAQQPLNTVGIALQADLVAVARARVVLLQKYTEALIEPIRLRKYSTAAAYKDRYTQAEAARVKLDALRHSNPGGVVDDLIASHN